jgi:hypothetical protein
MTRKLDDAELDHVCGGVEVTRMSLNSAHGSNGGASSHKPPEDDAGSDAKQL